MSNLYSLQPVFTITDAMVAGKKTHTDTDQYNTTLDGRPTWFRWLYGNGKTDEAVNNNYLRETFRNIVSPKTIIRIVVDETLYFLHHKIPEVVI